MVQSSLLLLYTKCDLNPLFLLSSVFAMESRHRKLNIPKLHFSEDKIFCFKKEYNPNRIKVCITPCNTFSCNFPPPIQFMFPPPLQPQLPKQSPLNEKHVLQNSAIIIGFAGCVFLFLIFMVLKYYNSKRNNQMIRNSSNQFDTPQEFVDEEHGFVFANTIHSIVTQGLSQPVIDSITVWKYKKDEGLIDGTECSVCLVEFQEDERLRLLPKCNHAFHISCIDIWLSSHKNCPLCRAPIVCENANVAQVSVSELNLNSSSVQRQEETQFENVVNNGETISHQVEEERRNSENSMKGLCNSSPILRILTDNEVIRGKEIQPIMRSVSLDSSSALLIYHALGNFIPDQGSTKSFVKNCHFGIISKQERKNLSLYKLMKSSSMGNTLHRRSISMKRSWSSSRKNFSSKLLSRSLSSILS